jgi:hypothetical protein
MPARSGRRLIERVGLTEAADTADDRQALSKRREAAIRAAIFPVISAPRIILRMSRRADHAHSGEESQKAKQCFHGCSFLTAGNVSSQIYVQRSPRAPHITICARKSVGRAPLVRLNMNIKPCWIFRATIEKDSAPHFGARINRFMSGNS